MNRVFEQAFHSSEKKLSSENFHHLKHVLRMEEQEIFQVVYQDGIFNCCFQQEQLCLLEKIEESHESSVKLALCFGILKGSKNEEILQHCTEVGVEEFYPLMMERSVADISKKSEQKIQRWQKIVEAAAKQSKRDCIPTVHPPRSLQQLLEDKDMTYLVAYEEEETDTFWDIAQRLPEKVGLIIGPEGGFSKKELELLSSAQKITLGKRILRAQTAAIVSSFYIIHSLEEKTRCKKHLPS